MFHPAETNLLNATILDAVGILRDDRMVAGSAVPIELLRADVAAGGTKRVRHDAYTVDGGSAVLGHVWHASNNDVRSGLRVTCSTIARHCRSGHLPDSKGNTSSGERPDQCSNLHDSSLSKSLKAAARHCAGRRMVSIISRH